MRGEPVEIPFTSKLLYFGLIVLPAVPVAVVVCFLLDRVRRVETLPGSDEWDETDDSQSQSSGVTLQVTDDGFRISAPTQNRIAYFSVPFVFVWSVTSIGVFYISQIVLGQFSLVLSVIGVPYLLLATRMSWEALMAVWGRVVITVANGQGAVFVGLGAWGTTKRFTWDHLTEVYESRRHRMDPRGWRVGIVIVSQGPLKFGWHPLTESRRHLIIRALRSMMRRAPLVGM